MINNQFYFIPTSVKTLAQLFSHREPHVLARADLIFPAASFLKSSTDGIFITDLEKNGLIHAQEFQQLCAQICLILLIGISF